LNANTSSQSRFEDRLLEAILDDFDQLTGRPAGRRGAGRRRAMTALAAGAAAVAVTAGAVAAVAGIGGMGGPAARHGSQRSAQILAGPKLETAAFVVGHMKSALNANTAIVDIIEHAPDSQTGQPVTQEIWSTRLSHTYRAEDLNPAGQPITGYLVTITAHRTVSIVVNYRDRTWSKTTYPFGSASSTRSPAPLPQTPLQAAARLRAQVQAGKVQLAGRTTVDGQRAIHLTQHVAGGLIGLWVSPVSYLPIRQIDTAHGVSPTSDQAIRDDYRWLPATRANMRLITRAAAIPAGFTRTVSNNGR
jgi:hypothetical protein